MTRVFFTPAIGTSLGHFWRSLIAIVLVLALSHSSFFVAVTAAAERDVLSPGELDQIGMVQAWRRHLSVPAGIQSIVAHRIVVHQTNPKQYVEVVGIAAKPTEKKPAADEKTPVDAPTSVAAAPPLYARYLIEVPDAPAEETSLTSQVSAAATGSMLDRMTLGGRSSFASSGLLDRAEAERRARNDIRRLKRRGIEAEIQSREVPVIRMYTLATDGTIESRDAETGELVWLSRVGDRVLGYSGIGVDDRFLTVINGTELIKLDVNDGSGYAPERLRFAPTHGPVHCGGYAVIPSVGNRMVGYLLDDLNSDLFSMIVKGAALAPATLAIGSDRIAWGTSGGFVYVMDTDGKPTIDFRFGTDGIVDGAIAAAPGDRFFFGSESGQIYGLRATRTGEVLWSRPTGDPIFDSPVVVGDKVLFRSTYGNLMCVDAETGIGGWDRMVGGIAQVIAVIDDQIFARSLGESFVVLNLSDGGIVQQLPGVSPHVLQTNIVSDRMYLIDRNGTIQCLHRPGAEMPTLPVTVEQQQKAEEQDQDAGKTKKPAVDVPANDPFGPGSSDPFGGGGADPFGAGGGMDPFAPAGGKDPFGG